jgi:hypothetical protein
VPPSPHLKLPQFPFFKKVAMAAISYGIVQSGAGMPGPPTRSAAEMRQGGKLRLVCHRWCGGLYGEFGAVGLGSVELKP